MDFSSFVTAVGTSFLIFVMLILLFNWLSKMPGNVFVYYPNRILRGLNPNESGSRSWDPFAWAREALKSTEQDVISVSGVDTAVYFVFLSTMLGILALSGLVLLPALLPLAATDDALVKLLRTPEGKNKSFSDIDKLSMANIEEKSPRLWGFLLAVYWVSIVTYFLLWKAYKHVSDLRATALMSPEVKPEQFAILVRDIPPVPEGQTRKEQVDSYFQSIYPDTFYRSMLVTDNKAVNKLWRKLEGFKKKLARAEEIYAKSKGGGCGAEGTRPSHKIGRKRVDSIDFYKKKIGKLVPKLKSEQKTTLRDKQSPAAIVFFTSRVVAASAAQSLQAQIVNHWTVLDAPEPRQIIWPNLKIKFFERQVRQYVIYFIVALTILIHMIPIFFYMTHISKSSAFKGLLKKALALTIFLAPLPKLLLFLSKAEGIPSHSHAIRASSGKYFYFSVLNVFIGVTIGGTLFTSLKRDNPKFETVVNLLAKSIPGNATFFLTFVALRFFFSYGLELSRLVPLIRFHFKKCSCKTEAEIKEAWLPGSLRYGTRVPEDMLIVTIVLCYSVIAPLIIPFGVAYFGLGWLILRNQALRVYVPSYESYGKLWPHMFIRVLAALILFQVTMFGYFEVKRFVFAPILIPLIIFSLVFGCICNKKFYCSFHNTALEVAARQLQETPNMEQIYRAFVPESLNYEDNDEDAYEEYIKDAHEEYIEDALSQDSRSTAPV